MRSQARRSAPLLLAGALAVVCCASPAVDDEPPLETEEVVPGPELDPSGDPVAAARVQPGLVGALPGHFPAELPIIRPSSVVDFQDPAAGLGSVTLMSDRTIESLQGALRRELSARGWTIDDRQPLEWSLDREGRSARLVFERQGSLSRYRFEYSER